MAPSGRRGGPQRPLKWCVLLCAVLATARRAHAIPESTPSAAPQPLPFRKCCPAGESLLKSENKSSQITYECIGRNEARDRYDVVHLPLVVGAKYYILEGFPGVCESTELVEKERTPYGSVEFCIDRIIAELEDGSLRSADPRVVTLGCALGESANVTTKDVVDVRTAVRLVKKCCPPSQSYDVTNHVCTSVGVPEDDERSIAELNGFDVYEVEHGMRCGPGMYGVELTTSVFRVYLRGAELTVRSSIGEHVAVLEAGSWCADREAGSGRPVVRGCSAECAFFGAYCVRKCCPMNYHYLPFSCNSTASRCVPDNRNASHFNLSSVMSSLQEDHFPATVAIRAEVLTCEEGKYALRSYHLTVNAELEQNNLSVAATTEYCLETFDYTFCGDTTHLDAVLCFHKPVSAKKNFYLSFIALTLSCVFMALTLLVYGALPELQNLHGKTLISHVSAMFFGYACLARVNLEYVPDKRLCAVLGYGIYFGFVAAFAWLNVMCLDIWWTFGSVRTVQPMRKADAELRRFAWYSLHAWGAAVALTLMMLLLDLYPITPYLDANIGTNYCWFGSLQNSATDWPHYIFFVIPMGVVTCVNLVLWVLTARHCARVRSDLHRMQAGSVGDRAKRRFRLDHQKYVLTGKLWVVMGAGWVWEVVSTITSEPYWFWTTVDLINSLQGLFIFIILVLKPKVFFLIKKRLGITEAEGQKKGTSSSGGRTSSTFLSRTISGGGDERLHLRASLPLKPHAA